MNRQARVRIAEQTMLILSSGVYDAPSGKRVDISETLNLSVHNTRLVRPSEWRSIAADARSAYSQSSSSEAIIEITGETTLAALRRLIVDQQRTDVAALNFASARNPGGGFLSGSQAQEESLARASGLYATLRAAPEYYEINRKSPTTVYTDYAILSPGVPVFRDDDARLLDEPYLASVITMPAINAGALPPGSPHMDSVPQVMERRMRNVFALAASSGYRTLVLGAWGCGAFRNDPEMIASLFARCLSGDDSWRPFFESIVFAVYDSTPDAANRSAFVRNLGGRCQASR
jgi:uncharacterized protein (TIGR02452 family)